MSWWDETRTVLELTGMIVAAFFTILWIVASLTSIPTPTALRARINNSTTKLAI
jgi:hypothetical protein